MKAIPRRRQWKTYIAVFSAIVLVASGIFVTLPKTVSAEGAYGDTGGSSGGGGGGSGYWSSNGFGWKLFGTGGGGPSGGFQSGNWSSISSQCNGLGADKVWVHVIRNGSGAEKSYSYEGSDYWGKNRPEAGGDPYIFDGAGNETSPAYGNGAIDRVATVQGHYLKANPSGSGWGDSIGWFCFIDNPPWSIDVGSDLKPKLAYAEPGQTITWEHTIENLGANKTNKAISWRWENRGDFPAGSGGNWTWGTGQAKGASAANTSTYDVQPSDFGKKLCRVTVATPSTHLGGTLTKPATSPPGACVVIAKLPKTQLLGGDLIVAGNVDASTTYLSNTTYGSWAEYAVLSSGTVKGYASGAAYKEGYSGSVAASGFCGVSLLSLNNLNGNPLVNSVNKRVTGSCNGSMGDYPVSAGMLASVLSSFSVSAAPYGSLADASQRRVESFEGTSLTINGGTIGKGDWLVINAKDATVTITGNINYFDGELNNINDIPQLVILAKNINIAGGVTNVDAWLMASGDINTCSDVSTTAPLSANVCSQQLKVNGPVSAGNLYLRRTYGAGYTPNAPQERDRPVSAAEVFTVRADAALWAIAHDTTTTPVSVASSAELPPRF